MKNTVSKWIPTDDPAVIRRLSKLSEEASEMIKAAMRCLMQGVDGIDPDSGRTNLEEVAREIADVLAQCAVTIEQFGFDEEAIFARAEQKKLLMEDWERLLNA